MTIIDERELLLIHNAVNPVAVNPVAVYPAAVHPVRRAPARPVGQRASRRPSPARPAVAPMRYRGTGIAVSSVSHRSGPVSTRVAIALAGLAALITVWLGSLAHLSSGSPAPTDIPEQLAVVRVQAGETLQRLAERVAPEASAAQVMRRISDLNQLGTTPLEAGQTLIAPIG